MQFNEETLSRSPSSVALSNLSSGVIQSFQKNNHKHLNQEENVEEGITQSNNSSDAKTKNAALTWEDIKKIIQTNKDEKSLSLEEFIHVLPSTIRMVEEEESESSSLNTTTSLPNHHSDTIGNLFQCIDWNNKPLLDPFLHHEPSKNYTRNLISTDNETYTLLALCWNPGKYSLIHDHPCNGCWMNVCEGCIHEVRYGVNVEEDSFEVLGESFFHEGEQTYINDSMGYHKVGNPSNNQMGISVHLYSPPFQKCQIWMNSSQRVSRSSVCNMCYSESGDRCIASGK